MLEIILIAATILGGIAAIWFFWDRFVTSGAERRRTAPEPEVVERWVDIRYPSDSGLQARLEAAGYSVRWCSDKHLVRKLDLDGWQVVVELIDDGTHAKFRLKTRPANQTLIMKQVA